jgi:uncharacterized Zn finger protein (UPF0148 family)
MMLSRHAPQCDAHIFQRWTGNAICFSA